MITLIAAMDEGRVIGSNNSLPWHIPADFAHFKATTMKQTIIMGRLTFESLPLRPLPHRRSIVITRDPAFHHAGVEVTHSIEEALAIAGRECFVIGGQTIYEQTIDLAHRLLITHVAGTHPGDAFFPEIGARWGRPRILSTGENYRIAEYIAF